MKRLQKTEMEREGHDALWRKLSYTGWLTMPRVLMHQMPDEWQMQMANLIDEYEATWDIPKEYWCEVEISLKQNGKYTRMFEWIANYKYPNTEMFNSWKR